jgi:division protein CdvB (Snf7/Vps24/ESCRT-III family)
LTKLLVGAILFVSQQGDAMSTQLEQLKEAIEDGDSVVEAYEQVDIEQMTEEGNGVIAARIAQVLDQIKIINAAAGID